MSCRCTNHPLCRLLILRCNDDIGMERRHHFRSAFPIDSFDLFSLQSAIWFLASRRNKVVFIFDFIHFRLCHALDDHRIRDARTPSLTSHTSFIESHSVWRSSQSHGPHWYAMRSCVQCSHKTFVEWNRLRAVYMWMEDVKELRMNVCKAYGQFLLKHVQCERTEHKTDDRRRMAVFGPQLNAKRKKSARRVICTETNKEKTLC